MRCIGEVYLLATRPAWVLKLFASHKRFVCRMAGFGADFQTSHTVGRQQAAIPQSMRDFVLPGVKSLTASLRASHPDHPLLSTLQAVDWLADVFVQDMPLKLALYGHSWARLFPREVAAICRHPNWPSYAQQVLADDARCKALAVANRDLKSNPVQVGGFTFGPSAEADDCLLTRCFADQGLMNVLRVCQDVSHAKPAMSLEANGRLLSKRQRQARISIISGCCSVAVAHYHRAHNEPCGDIAG